jgi:hypothetical protein
MSFQIVYPIAMSINAGSFKDAIKQYVKFNHDVNIANIIITDQQRYMKANLKYYNEGQKNKVGISLFPTVWPLNSTDSLFIRPNMWPYDTQITYDTKEYPRSTYLESPVFVPSIVPLNPLGSVFSNITNFFGRAPVYSSGLVSDVSPLSPIIPSVVRYK